MAKGEAELKKMEKVYRKKHGIHNTIETKKI